MKKKNLYIITTLIIFIILLNDNTFAGSTIKSLKRDVDLVWDDLGGLLLTILGLAGGISCMIGGIMFFTQGNNEKSKNFLLGGLIGLILYAVLKSFI